jgi:hypothetical protein
VIVTLGKRPAMTPLYSPGCPTFSLPKATQSKRDPKMHAPFECLLLVLPLFFTLTSASGYSSNPILDRSEHQEPMMDTPTGQTISDVIGRNEEIAIFSGFTRDVASVSERFESSSKNVTVLAPQDSAIKALPRKPWENPTDYSTFGASAYEGQSGIDRAQQNLRIFVEQHIVGTSPWKEGEEGKTLGGDSVWFENRDGVKYVSRPISWWPMSKTDRYRFNQVILKYCM